MLARLKPFAWPLVIAAFAATIYVVRIHQEMVDFEVYRQAASRAMHSENLYQPDDGHYQYKYLPAFAFAMAPFAMVEARFARLVWYALSFGLLCAFVRWSAVAVPDRRLTTGALAGFAVLFVGRFYGRELNLGQTNILLGAILVGALIAAEMGARRTAGVLVALAVFVKPYALILVPWVWLVAGIPGLAAGTIVMAAGLLLPALAYGWHGNIDQVLGWYRTVIDTSAPNLMAPENISFGTAWAKWIGTGPLASKLALATSVGAAGLAGFIMSKRRHVREPAYLEFGALMLLVPLLSPQGWDYLLVIATPAVMVIVDRWRETTPVWRAIAALALAGIGFTIIDVMGRTLYGAVLRTSVITICVLALLLCLANLRMKRLA